MNIYSIQPGQMWPQTPISINGPDGAYRWPAWRDDDGQRLVDVRLVDPAIVEKADDPRAFLPAVLAELLPADVIGAAAKSNPPGFAWLDRQ